MRASTRHRRRRTSHSPSSLPPGVGGVFSSPRPNSSSTSHRKIIRNSQRDELDSILNQVIDNEMFHLNRIVPSPERSEGRA